MVRAVNDDWGDTVHVDLVGNCYVVAKYADILQSRPPSNGTMPPNDRAFHPSVIFNSGAFEQDASLQTNTIANNAVRANSYVGSNATILADFGRRVN